MTLPNSRDFFFENRSNKNPIEFNKKYAERDQVKYDL